MMKRLFATMCIGIVLAASAATARAAEFGTAAEAEALVKKAIAFIKTEGKEKALSVFSDPKGPFVDRDMYVTVYDFTGKCLAHGANQKMVGRELIDMKDPDGRLIFKERLDVAKAKGKGWQNYKWPHPLTKKMEDKAMYFEKHEDVVVAAGIYRK